MSHSSSSIAVVSKDQLIPFDGVVIEGFAVVDESAIAGVSTPVIIDAENGRNQVYTGGLIVDGSISIKRV